jgi:hypothetical protein
MASSIANFFLNRYPEGTHCWKRMFSLYTKLCAASQFGSGTHPGTFESWLATELLTDFQTTLKNDETPADSINRLGKKAVENAWKRHLEELSKKSKEEKRHCSRKSFSITDAQSAESAESTK